MTGTHLLFAAGRVPNIEMLNLNSARIKAISKEYIIVNNKLKTTMSRVYIPSDIKGSPAFIHIFYDDFCIIQVNLINKSNS